jgi:drug/metabolite transporter superfamily protein YnfA
MISHLPLILVFGAAGFGIVSIFIGAFRHSARGRGYHHSPGVYIDGGDGWINSVDSHNSHYDCSGSDFGGFGDSGCDD